MTLDSPNARDPGEFHWGETLWHEIAHVITLQMSNNRLPRWLSEGISVWEERRARPEWGREMDLAFAQAINEDKVLKLKVLNEGFSDPRLISLSYYQASLVVDHIVDTYGEPKLRAFIRAYGDGLETEAAVKEVARRQPRPASDGLRRPAREAVRLAAQVAPDAEVRAASRRSTT